MLCAVSYRSAPPSDVLLFDVSLRLSDRWALRVMNGLSISVLEGADRLLDVSDGTGYVAYQIIALPRIRKTSRMVSIKPSTRGPWQARAASAL